MENEKQATQTPFQIGLYYGTVLSLFSVIFTLLMVFLPVATAQSTWFGVASTILNLIIMFLVISMSINTLKTQQGGYVSFGQGVNISAWIGVVSGVVNSFWSFFYFTYINPNYMKNIRQQTILKLEEQSASEEQLAMQMQLLDFFFSPLFTIPVGFISVMIFTLIIGLIVAAIAKKEKEHPW